MASKGPKLTTMNVSLTKPLRDFVQSQVDRGAFANASEYIRHLLREEQNKFVPDADLEELIWEGIESGPGVPMDERFWNTVRENVRRRAAARKPRKKAG